MINGAWFSQHPHLYMICVLVVYWCVSALVERLPAPTASSGSLYKSIYAALQTFTAGLKAATQTFKSVLPTPPAPAPTSPPPKK